VGVGEGEEGGGGVWRRGVLDEDAAAAEFERDVMPTGADERAKGVDGSGVGVWNAAVMGWIGRAVGLEWGRGGMDDADEGVAG